MDPNLAAGFEIARLIGHWTERHWLAIGTAAAVAIFIADRLRGAEALQGRFPHIRNRRGPRRAAPVDGEARRRQPLDPQA